MTLPNLITIARIAAVPLIVWFIVVGRFTPAFAVFLAAGVSDAIDGFLARRFAMRSELGAWLDPIADKALLVSIYVTLGMMFHLEQWLVILVVSRDIAIVVFVMLAYVMGRKMPMAPSMISKINTAAQIALAGLVLASLGMAFDAARAIEIGAIIVAATTATSGVHYLIQWLKVMTESENGKPGPGARSSGGQG